MNSIHNNCTYLSDFSYWHTKYKVVILLHQNTPLTLTVNLSGMIDNKLASRECDNLTWFHWYWLIEKPQQEIKRVKSKYSVQMSRVRETVQYFWISTENLVAERLIHLQDGQWTFVWILNSIFFEPRRSCNVNVKCTLK